MAKVYIANATNQNHIFLYRIPERAEAVMQEIPLGQQVALSSGRDFSTVEIKMIMDQHRPYGMVEVVEIPRTANFSGLCISIDKPINIDRVRELFLRNRAVLTERGRKIRSDFAMASSQQLEQEGMMSQIPDTLRALSVSVEEITRTRDPLDDSPEINEGVRVSKDVPVENKASVRRASRGRRARIVNGAASAH